MSEEVKKLLSVYYILEALSLHLPGIGNGIVEV